MRFPRGKFEPEGIPFLTSEDLARFNELLRGSFGTNYSWTPSNLFDLWVEEVRLKADQRAAHRLLLATWALALFTLGLVVATVGLIVVTIKH